MRKIYHEGAKVYIDGFGGMIRGKVLKINNPGCNGRIIGERNDLIVEVLETKGGYKQGETVKRIAAYTPPVEQIKKRKHEYKIDVNYEFQPYES